METCKDRKVLIRRIMKAGSLTMMKTVWYWHFNRQVSLKLAKIHVKCSVYYKDVISIQWGKLDYPVTKCYISWLINWKKLNWSSTVVGWKMVPPEYLP